MPSSSGLRHNLDEGTIILTCRPLPNSRYCLTLLSGIVEDDQELYSRHSQYTG